MSNRCRASIDESSSFAKGADEASVALAEDDKLLAELLQQLSGRSERHAHVGRATPSAPITSTGYSAAQRASMYDWTIPRINAALLGEQAFDIAERRSHRFGARELLDEIVHAAMSLAERAVIGDPFGAYGLRHVAHTTRTRSIRIAPPRRSCRNRSGFRCSRRSAPIRNDAKAERRLDPLRRSRLQAIDGDCAGYRSHRLCRSRDLAVTRDDPPRSVS